MFSNPKLPVEVEWEIDETIKMVVSQYISEEEYLQILSHIKDFFQSKIKRLPNPEEQEEIRGKVRIYAETHKKRIERQK